MNPRYFCCDEKRRAAVRLHATLNGIDFLEVHDGSDVPLAERQRTLFVHFLKDAGLAALTDGNIRIEGGERIRDVAATGVDIDPEDPLVLVVEVNHPGDFSTYTLRLVRSPEDAGRLDGFDPLLSAVEFSFKVECADDFDCAPEHLCPPDMLEQAEIDYLAKDYASFRRLMLDRLGALAPDWRERNPADLGVALVEVLAYVADHLSYQQDAIATEAYLGAARRRVSVRRHARLVDYFMHDGRNARAWAHVRLDENTAPADGMRLVPYDVGTRTRTRFLTRCLADPRIAPEKMDEVLRDHAPEVFEPLADAWLFAEHNEMTFYTWGDERCCLPKGATRATLRDDPERRLRLRPGDVLVFEERLGPRTGKTADADRSHRQAVRLTYVSPAATVAETVDLREMISVAPELATDPLTGQAIVEIAWAPEDALTFPLCLSAVTDEDHGERALSEVSVALGNIVPVDHGLTIEGEGLGTVPLPLLFLAPGGAGPRCEPGERIALPPRFNPALRQGPITQAGPYDASAPAAAYREPHLRAVLPAVQLTSVLDATILRWRPQRDLLGSKADDPFFVVEIESDGRAFVRFGDDANGRRPDSGTTFATDYRVGNGAAGNVGAEAIYHVVAAQAMLDAIASVCNPLSAGGGIEPESLDDVRARAPEAFKTQERAVTLADYGARAGSLPGVQQAAAALRWTGSWRTVFVTADRAGGLPVTDPFETALRSWIEPYRMAGQDLEVDAPVPVALVLTMRVCARADYFRSDVRQALTQVFSARTLPGGGRGVFHPDNFSFGQTIYLSALYAAAQAVQGVESVEVVRFKRRGRPGPDVPPDGKLTFAGREIPRLDNDRSFPERGAFELIVEGGK